MNSTTRTNALEWIRSQFGRHYILAKINDAIWDHVERTGDFPLSAVIPTAETLEEGVYMNSPEESVMSVLSLLAASIDHRGGFLQMMYRTEDGAPVETQIVLDNLHAWHKAKTMSTEKWKAWADSVKVYWGERDSIGACDDMNVAAALLTASLSNDMTVVEGE